MKLMHRAPRPRIAHALVLAVAAAGVSPVLAQDSDGFKVAPTGFISFTGVARSTNVGTGPSSGSNSNGFGTDFGQIPYSNTVQGSMSETRFSAADTRLGLKAATKLGDVDLRGLVETDFLGSDAGNVYVSGNSHILRVRLAYLNTFSGNWEVLAGQAWSWMTPNRRGLSADPADVFTTLNVDPNMQVGLTWTRAAQIRFAHHPSKELAWGIALESPDQYVGFAEVIYPFAFNAQLSSQFDAGNNPEAPNRYPDVLGKIAWDPEIGGRLFHMELVGLYRTFQISTTEIGGSNDLSTKSGQGGGVALNLNLEIFRDFRLIANAFASSGGGRYISGLGPDVVVKPHATGPAVFTATISPVKSQSYLGGAEWGVGASDVVAAYYGVARFSENSFADVTSPILVKPTIGLGGNNSPNSANKEIWEASADWLHTFTSQPGKGAVQGLLQLAHASRRPFFVATGAPEQAQVNMVFASLRYLLP